MVELYLNNPAGIQSILAGPFMLYFDEVSDRQKHCKTTLLPTWTVTKHATRFLSLFFSLVIKQDLQPYLPSVVPGLKTALLDPVPDVRRIAAKALGAMVKGMGESSFDDLLPWLMEKLTSEQNSVDRSGAAQGLYIVFCCHVR